MTNPDTELEQLNLTYAQIQIIKQREARMVAAARIDELKQLWNSTQPDIKPEGSDDYPIDPAIVKARILELQKNN